MNTTKLVNSTPDNEGLGRVLGACALFGVGLVVSSLVPAVSPVILGRWAFEAGRIIGGR